VARRDDVPAVIAPPPLLFLIALALGFGLDAVLATAVLDLMPAAARLALAAAALVLAGGLGVGGILAFRRARTALEPWHPTTALVTTGVYGRVRNPMYLGLVLILLAIALATARDGVALATAGLAPVLHYGVVKREERYLSERFGAPYRRYLAAVPRWGLPISRSRDDH
jgi:protein-S-isoprenylcysteine O-methyltransferase Ste14